MRSLQPLSLAPFAAQLPSALAGSRRWGSLSAIHGGRRREERIQSQGSRSSWRQGTNDAASGRPSNSLTYAQRQAARKAAPKPARIRKGKKDITINFKEAPRSRAGRFNDPNMSFGKKSMVYKAKSGELQNELRELEASVTPAKTPRDRSTRSRRRTASHLNNRQQLPDRATGRGDLRHTATARGRAGDFQPRRDRDVPQTRPGLPENERRPPIMGNGRDGSRRLATSGSGGWLQHGQEDRGVQERRSRTDEQIFAPPRRTPHDRQNVRERDEALEDEGGFRHRQTEQAEDEPQLSLPYSTAASQFLYGASVVEAALQASRRLLYKLYVYGGPNKQFSPRDDSIERLAQRRGVEVHVLRENAQRLMEKMSLGRPHNGYILEASPLPQLPLIGLGDMEEHHGKPGFRVAVAHQSAEDAKINGVDDFVRTGINGYKPLVVVLDQILDPGNLGATLRSVKFLGADAVVVTKRNSASLTPVALKASAGASELVTLFSADDLQEFLVRSKESGWHVYAAVPATARSRHGRQLDMHQLEDADPLSKNPCILLIGNEGEGLSKQLKSKADYEVSIPNMSGSGLMDSLNVSVAAGLLCSSFVKGKTNAQFQAVEGKRLETALW